MECKSRAITLVGFLCASELNLAQSLFVCMKYGDRTVSLLHVVHYHNLYCEAKTMTLLRSAFLGNGCFSQHQVQTLPVVGFNEFQDT